MVLQFNRHFQKLAILSTLLLCTSLLYFHRSPIPYLERQIPQLSSNGTHHVSQALQRADYSIKPLVYIFPQYYVFEDNNRLHGENFTEWVNVKKVTHNAFGLETIRPHESIGFYNGLELKTRERQGRFLRDHGFYGAVFHHYWFAGRPVMEHVIQKMLDDGEPNVPFMLSVSDSLDVPTISLRGFFQVLSLESLVGERAMVSEMGWIGREWSSADCTRIRTAACMEEAFRLASTLFPAPEIHSIEREDPVCGLQPDTYRTYRASDVCCLEAVGC